MNQTTKEILQKLRSDAIAERKGSKENMEFQRDVTQNESNTKFWEGSIFGQQTIIDLIERLLQNKHIK